MEKIISRKSELEKQFERKREQNNRSSIRKRPQLIILLKAQRKLIKQLHSSIQIRPKLIILNQCGTIHLGKSIFGKEKKKIQLEKKHGLNTKSLQFDKTLHNTTQLYTILHRLTQLYNTFRKPYKSLQNFTKPCKSKQ